MAEMAGGQCLLPCFPWLPSGADLAQVLLLIRVLCDGQPCLPVGTSDLPGTSTVKIFCPKCEDIYYPRIDYQVGASGLSCL
jgi:hypothetical protein